MPLSKLEAGEVGAALVQVIDVGQHAGLRMAAFHGHQHRLAQPVERFGKAPHFDLRHDADVIAQRQQRAITLGHLQVIDIGNIGRARRRCRDAFAADLLDEVHVAPRLLQALGPPGVVVDDPFGKADRAFDR